MISIKQINEKDIDLCYELDSNTISLWNKRQWANEFKKEGTKIFGLLITNLVIGICVFQIVLDEAQINYSDIRFQNQICYQMNLFLCIHVCGILFLE